MTDEEITKLANQLTVNLATKEDIQRLEQKLITNTQSLEIKISEINEKADQILVYAHSIDDVVHNHEKRLQKIEAIPSIKNTLH